MIDEVNFYNNNGQINYAKDDATINAQQKINTIQNDDFDHIVESIEKELQSLKEEEADAIRETIAMVKEELRKPEPKTSGIRRCITLLAPMFTIANGIPMLLSNLQALASYLQSLIVK